MIINVCICDFSRIRVYKNPSTSVPICMPTHTTPSSLLKLLLLHMHMYYYPYYYANASIHAILYGMVLSYEMVLYVVVVTCFIALPIFLVYTGVLLVICAGNEKAFLVLFTSAIRCIVRG